MGLEPGSLIGWVMIGLMAGSLATQFMSGRSYGIGRDIGIGLLGALVGGFAASLVVQGQGGMLAGVVGASVGAILLTRLARAVPRQSIV